MMMINSIQKEHLDTFDRWTNVQQNRGGFPYELCRNKTGRFTLVETSTMTSIDCSVM